jgi:CTP synthase
MWEAGMIFSGTSPNDRLVEIIELRDHPWFVASQFHPEFRSRPNRPHPLFREFVKAAAVKAGVLPAGVVETASPGSSDSVEAREG